MIQIVTLMIGLGAIAYAVYGIASDRTNARLDTCRLIVGLVDATTAHNPRARAQADQFIAHTVLHNCHVYAQEG